MIRGLMWFGFYLLCLGFLSFDVKYRDGLHIKLHNWADRKRLK